MQKTISTKIYIATFVAIAALLASVIVPTAVSARPNPAAAAARPGSQTIAQIAIDGNFTTLVAALSCTDLVPAVSGNRQLTVFAPTDAAFDKLDLNAGNVCTEIEKDALTNILLYHVTSGRRNSTSVLAAPSYNMLNGSKLTRSELGVAGFFATDISARNGIVHVIDSVLLP